MSSSADGLAGRIGRPSAGAVGPDAGDAWPVDLSGGAGDLATIIDTRGAALEQARSELVEAEAEMAALLVDARRQAWLRSVALRDQILTETDRRVRARELVAEAQLAQLILSARSTRDYQAARLVTAVLGLGPPEASRPNRRAV